MSIAVLKKWALLKIDVSSAFLQLGCAERGVNIILPT